MWTIAYRHRRDRTPAQGYEPTREAAMAAQMAGRKGLVEMPVACEQTIE